jgi:glycosyltransferase involved in cell wall biosynthesis
VVKEAMACGIPVVATRLEGVREILRDGQEALLVTPGQSEPLAAAILRVARDSDLRRALLARASERVQDFSAERMVERNLEVYGRVLARRRR